MGGTSYRETDCACYNGAMARKRKKAKKNTGKAFESLNKQIFELLSANEAYTSVEQNVSIESPEGPRQFDVVLRSKASGIDLLTVIECRDHPTKNLDIKQVDGFFSKMQDVNASHGVLVARKGFSPGAKKKAKRLGITLCTAHDISNLHAIGFHIPITITDVIDIQIYFKGHMHVEKEGTAISRKALVEVGGVPITELFANAIRAGEVPPVPNRNMQMWNPINLNTADAYINDSNGHKVAITEFALQYTMKVNYYRGSVEELPSTIGMNNLSRGDTTIFMKGDDLQKLKYRETFQKFLSYEDMPSHEGLHLQALATPEMHSRGADVMNIYPKKD